MSEQQLRDVLARVVPDAPDQVADPLPVVRAARRRRTVTTTGASVFAALTLIGGVLVAQSLIGGDRPDTVDLPADIADPYATAPCPELSDRWINVPVRNLDDVVTVRYCARDTESADVADGPRDALVTGLDDFAAAVRTLEAADPERCGPDKSPTDSRLLLQYADGTAVATPAGACQDGLIEGRTLDGADITMTFLSALAEQRERYTYTTTTEPATCLFGSSDISPARPGTERIVAAVACGVDDGSPLVLGGAGLAALSQAWEGAASTASACEIEDELPVVFARTDRGDNIQIRHGSCGLVFVDDRGVGHALGSSVEAILVGGHDEFGDGAVAEVSPAS